jgi:hypothetical protein
VKKRANIGALGAGSRFNKREWSPEQREVETDKTKILRNCKLYDETVGKKHKAERSLRFG